MTSALRKQWPTEQVNPEDRASAVRSAVASARLEGVEITPATQKVFEDYASGAIDSDDMMDRVLSMYGPGA